MAINHGLIVGTVVSLVVHGGVLLLFSRPAEAPPEPTSSPPTLEVIDLPLPDLEEEMDFSQDDGPETAEPQMSYAPPMLADVPSLVTVDSFIQPLQPPPPEAPKPGAIVIPMSRINTTGAEVGQLFNLRDLDRPPREIVRVAPVLPNTMLSRNQDRATGQVVVMFTVDAEGKARDPMIVESSREEYEDPALEAVLKWRFQPGRKDGRNVSTRVRVRIDIVPPDRPR